MHPWIVRIFDSFSRRHRVRDEEPKPLPLEFRQRVLMLCADTFARQRYDDSLQRFWGAIQRTLAYRVGKHQLTPGSTSSTEDACPYLLRCADAEFLSFIEDIFKSDEYLLLHDRPWLLNDMVEKIDGFFEVDDLPYSMTRFVASDQYPIPPPGVPARDLVRNYPQVIIRDSQVTHALAIEPALTLFRSAAPDLQPAHQEFLAALADYRAGDYGDCLTKCGSAFESVLKIACDRNGWTYDKQKDTAGRLIDIVLSNSSLEARIFKEPLLAVARLRNTIGSAHGSGAVLRQVSKPRALYAITSTAASILLVASECIP